MKIPDYLKVPSLVTLALILAWHKTGWSCHLPVWGAQLHPRWGSSISGPWRSGQDFNYLPCSFSWFSTLTCDAACWGSRCEKKGTRSLFVLMGFPQGCSGQELEPEQVYLEDPLEVNCRCGPGEYPARSFKRKSKKAGCDGRMSGLRGSWGLRGLAW